MDLIPVSKGAFEIFVNGHQLYSKLETGMFPDHDEMINQIEDMK